MASDPLMPQRKPESSGQYREANDNLHGVKEQSPDPVFQSHIRLVNQQVPWHSELCDLESSSFTAPEC